MSSDEDTSEVDPRVKIELDSLNQATDEINRLETELSAERHKFSRLHSDAKERLGILMNDKEKWIARARPYYEILKEAKQADESLQLAVNNYHLTNGVYRAAKETIKLAEQTLSELGKHHVDAAWQEAINRNVKRFNEAELEKTKSENLHAQAAKRREVLAKRAQIAKNKHKRSMEKAREYFETKDKFEAILQEQRARVEAHQKKIEGAKQKYKNSLKNLERISSEIHQRRLLEASIAKIAHLSERRVSGVGSSSSSDELDTIPHREYGMEDLEADLEKFDFDDDVDSDVSSEEYSETESERSSTSSSLTRQRSSKKKRKSVKSSTSSRTSIKINKNAIIEEEEDLIFKEQSAELEISPKKKVSTRKVVSAADVTDSLHGVHMTTNHTQVTTNNKSDDDDADDFDIFDELC